MAQDENKHYEILRDFVMELLRRNTLGEVLESVVDSVIEQLGFDDCVIFLWDAEQQELIPRAAHGGIGVQRRHVSAIRRLDPETGIVGVAYRTRQPARIADTRQSPDYVRDTVCGLSELAVPIVYEDQVIGVIDSEHPDVGYYTAAHEELMVLVAAVSAPRIANLQTIARLNSIREQLSISRNFIRGMIDTAPNVLYVLDYGRKVMIEGREKFARFLGFTTDEIDAMEDGVYSLVHPDDRDSVAAQEARLASAARGTVVPVEFRLRNRAGEYRWCLISSKVFEWDADGEPAMEVGSVMDISSVKSAQSALRRREQQIQALFENCFDCIILYDRFGNCVYTTPSVERFTGYTEKETIGHHALDFVVAEDHAQAVRVWWELIHNPDGRAISEHRIRHKDGRAIWIEARLTNHLDDGSVRGIVVNFHEIGERKAAEARIFQLANFDALTGLPNRRLLMDRLQEAVDRARRSGTGLVLMYLDLDRFKNINDTLGHDVGDRLLVKVATRLRGLLSPESVLARLGGDEFAVVLPEATVGRGRDVARSLVQAMQEPFQVDDYDIRLTTSVGVARFPDHGTEVEELFKHADIAMYRAKTHRNRYAVFEAGDAAAMVLRVGLEKDLQRALEQSELELWYQPRLRLETGETVAVEALLRWRCPMRGLVLPGTFIPVAEETGLIYRIGEWVLEAACRQAALWRSQGCAMRVGVNLSARELMRPDIVNQVSRTLERHSLPGEAIELEITETAAMTDLDFSLRILNQLRELGVRLAIDDFGTGHSSLSYLRQLPVDCLKIDQSFLPRGDVPSDHAQQSVITGIVLLAESVGLTVVAEGVETEEQHRFLKAVGCEEAQGYYYARPAPADEMFTTEILLVEKH